MLSEYLSARVLNYVDNLIELISLNNLYLRDLINMLKIPTLLLIYIMKFNYYRNGTKTQIVEFFQMVTKLSRDESYGTDLN